MRIAKSWCPHQKKMSKEKMGKEMGREKVGKEKKAYKEKKKGKNLKKIRCTKQGCCGLPKLAPEEKGCSHWLPCHGLDSPKLWAGSGNTISHWAGQPHHHHMGWTAPPWAGQPHHGLDSSWAGQPQHGLDSPPKKTKSTST